MICLKIGCMRCLVEVLEDIVEASEKEVEIRGQTYTIPSDTKMQEYVREMFEDQLKANTAQTLGLRYQPSTLGVVGEEVDLGVLGSINVTQNALDQGIKYARYMKGEGDLEVLFHMVGNTPNLVTSIVPAYDQHVTPTTCTGRPFLVQDYGFDAQYMGWCHSHVSFESFHSPTDNKNTLQGIDMYNKYIPGTTIRYQPSLVLNCKGELYGAMGVSWDLDDRQDRIIRTHVNIVDDDIPVFDIDIERFAKENIRCNNGFESTRERARKSTKDTFVYGNRAIRSKLQSGEHFLLE